MRRDNTCLKQSKLSSAEEDGKDSNTLEPSARSTKDVLHFAFHVSWVIERPAASVRDDNEKKDMGNDNKSAMNKL